VGAQGPPARRSARLAGRCAGARVPPMHYQDKLDRVLVATKLNPGVQFSVSKRVQFQSSSGCRLTCTMARLHMVASAVNWHMLPAGDMRPDADLRVAIIDRPTVLWWAA
jgi:hypothetical protein